MPGDRRGHTPVQPAAPWPQPRRRQTPSPPWPRGWAPPRAPPARFRGGHAGRTLPLPGLTSRNTWPARGRGRSGGARSETPKVGGCARSAGRRLRPGRAPSAPAWLVRSVPCMGETRSHLVCHPPPTSLPPRQEDEAEMSSRDRSQPRAGVAAPRRGLPQPWARHTEADAKHVLRGKKRVIAEAWQSWEEGGELAGLEQNRRSEEQTDQTRCGQNYGPRGRAGDAGDAGDAGARPGGSVPVWNVLSWGSGQA